MNRDDQSKDRPIAKAALSRAMLRYANFREAKIFLWISPSRAALCHANCGSAMFSKAKILNSFSFRTARPSPAMLCPALSAHLSKAKIHLFIAAHCVAAFCDAVFCAANRTVAKPRFISSLPTYANRSSSPPSIASLRQDRIAWPTKAKISFVDWLSTVSTALYRDALRTTAMPSSARF